MRGCRQRTIWVGMEVIMVVTWEVTCEDEVEEDKVSEVEVVAEAGT